MLLKLLRRFSIVFGAGVTAAQPSVMLDGGAKAAAAETASLKPLLEIRSGPVAGRDSFAGEVSLRARIEKPVEAPVVAIGTRTKRAFTPPPLARHNHVPVARLASRNSVVASARRVSGQVAQKNRPLARASLPVAGKKVANKVVWMERRAA